MVETVEVPDNEAIIRAYITVLYSVTKNMSDFLRKLPQSEVIVLRDRAVKAADVIKDAFLDAGGTK